MSVLDRGHIALVLVDAGAIPVTRSDPVNDVRGRYYDDDGGHFLVVKGYSIDRKYFVVYDPYPSDWDSNAIRYEDEVTMIGKNRFYAANELVRAMKSSTVIEVFPKP